MKRGSPSSMFQQVFSIIAVNQFAISFDNADYLSGLRKMDIHVRQ